MGVTLERGCPADAAAIARLHVDAWQETYAGLLPDAELAALSVDERSAMWSSVLAPERSAGAAVWVARSGDLPVGFRACGRQGDGALLRAGFSGEFGALYLLRSHHGRGIGRSLMMAMAATLRADGHVAASLWVLRANGSARAFYRRLGGTIVAGKGDEPFVEDGFGWRDLTVLLA